MKPLSPVNEFSAYADTLEDMALLGNMQPRVRVDAALDGEAYRELRRVVALPVRRRYGAFFTGSKLATRLLARQEDAEFHHDPSCGVGDLLLAAARHFPIGRTLNETLQSWSKRIRGRDLHSEFIRGAKARLTLLARSRGNFIEELSQADFDNSFPHVLVGDGLSSGAVPDRPGMILMNPPYSVIQAPVGHEWSNGKLNQAALFIDHYVTHSPTGTRILAILPEVLRTGTSYRKWRNHIATQAASLAVRPWGLFDPYTDVDVFVLEFVKATNVRHSLRKWPSFRSKPLKLRDRFNVSVGSVVPHRDPETGPWRRFITSRTAPAFETINRLPNRRRFQGTAVKPPFVVIKRTSRPGDKFRAIPTLILGQDEVAVENHLIVCAPKDGTQKTCITLVKELKHSSVSAWLNTSMRCRHLTVESVRLIPLC